MNYQLDGAGHNDTFLNMNLPFPNPDAVQEFTLESNSLSAQFGSSAGGVVNIVTRSGTNEIHGDVFEFLRNGALNARNFFAPTHDSLNRNQFGGAVGGPVIKNELFYFGTYQGTRVRSAAQGQIGFAPTAARVPVLVAGALFEEGGNEGVAFVLDLSEQKRAEDRVVKNEERTRLMLDEALDAVVTMDANGVTTGWNTQAEVIFGWSREDAVGRRISDTIIPARHREAHERGLRHFLATGEGAVLNRRIEMTALSRDGREFPVELSVTPLKLGQTWIFSAFIRDITERKRGEKALETAFEEIRALKDQLYKENLALRDEVDRASMFEEIVGTSKPLQTVLSQIAKVAPTDSTVIITGETGTGKELIARAVHKRSHRNGRAFVSVNCAALAPSLISSELFGHEKGAFTGAIQRRLGRFELADGGTIFLDEVGELLPDTQAALLRVLQEREFERVGGGQLIHVDVRVITATNRDLKAAAANGTFRQDLFYRLNVFPIEVPPLRERNEDILMLVEYFVRRYANRAGKNIRSIDKKTLDLLQSYDWPGNIRDLQNVIKRSVILSSGDVLSVDELWLSKD